jgi:hypothetical protein
MIDRKSLRGPGVPPRRPDASLATCGDALESSREAILIARPWSRSKPPYMSLTAPCCSGNLFPSRRIQPSNAHGTAEVTYGTAETHRGSPRKRRGVPRNHGAQQPSAVPGRAQLAEGGHSVGCLPAIARPITPLRQLGNGTRLIIVCLYACMLQCAHTEADGSAPCKGDHIHDDRCSDRH